MGPVLRKKIIYERIFLLIIVLFTFIYSLTLVNKIAIDDAFITYRYARNIATGIGFVYNQGERILSTTTPLYAIILAISYYINVDLPTNSNIIGSISIIFIELIIYKILTVLNSKIIAKLVSVILISTTPIVYLTLGMETPLYCFLLLLSVYYYIMDDLHKSSLFSAVATLLRIDAVLLISAIYLCYILENTKNLSRSIDFVRHLSKKILKAFIFYLLPLTPWLIFSQIYFGSIIPHTFYAKIFQMESHLCWQSNFTIEFLKFLNKDFKLLLPFFIIGIAEAFLSVRKMIIFVVYIVIYLLSYFSFPYYHWYSLPPLVGFIILSSHGIESLAERLHNHSTTIRVIAIFFISIILVAHIVPIIPKLMNLADEDDFQPGLDNKRNFYRMIGEKFSKAKFAEKSVGAPEIGIIGYYSQRYIVDFAGLLQPDISSNLGKNKIFEVYKPDYIVYSPSFRPLIPNDVYKYYVWVEKYTVGGQEWYILEKINKSYYNTIFLYTLLDNVKTNLNALNLKILDISGQPKISINQHPISNTKRAIISFENLTLPANAKLKFSIALDPRVWDPNKGDGVTFEVFIKHSGKEEKVFSKYIDPKHNPEERKWNDFEVDLSKYGGENVTIILSTLPGPKNDSRWDWAWWGEPRIEW